jgi:23S rRNA pseudouridine1911/1915/1917 synthase
MRTFDPQKQIVYEDNHIIVVDKYPSQIVQGDKTGDEPLNEALKKYLKVKYNKPGDVFLGVVHRLDRPTSGLVIFARTSKALIRLNQMLQNHEIHKTYRAIVRKKKIEKTAKLTHHIYKNSKQNKSFVGKAGDKRTKKAILDYVVIGESDSFFLLEITLHTGRHHQIRVQLSSIGLPIKGDIKYGYSRTNRDASISLNAHQIEFIHPVKKTLVNIVSSVDLPDFTKLRFKKV